MIITLCSVRGAPGVSVSAVLLAAAWPGTTDRVVLEADLDGGVLGARYGVGVEPGAGALVSALRHDVTDERLLERSARRVDQHVWLVPGPESATTATRLWGADRAVKQVADALAADARVWFVDAGRASSRSVTAPLIERSALALLFSRDQPADLLQLPERVAELRALGTEAGVVIVGAPAYRTDELRTFCGVERLWRVTADPAIVAHTQRGWADRRLRRTPVWRDLVAVAADLADAWTPSPAGEPDA